MSDGFDPLTQRAVEKAVGTILKRTIQNSMIDELVGRGYATGGPFAPEKSSDREDDMTGPAIKDVIKRAMGEKSMADKAYDKFIADKNKHLKDKRDALAKLSERGKPCTAYDMGEPMVMMWELLSDKYVEDVTPRGRTGGAISPDTTYVYRITSLGRLWANIYMAPFL